MELNAEVGIEGTLRQALSGKGRVEVHLLGGASFAGTVASLGPNAVVLSHLSQREFFDAVIRLDEIAAVAAQVRKS